MFDELFTILNGLKPSSLFDVTLLFYNLLQAIPRDIRGIIYVSIDLALCSLVIRGWLRFGD